MTVYRLEKGGFKFDNLQVNPDQTLHFSYIGKIIKIFRIL